MYDLLVSMYTLHTMLYICMTYLSVGMKPPHGIPTMYPIVLLDLYTSEKPALQCSINYVSNRPTPFIQLKENCLTMLD